MDVMEWFPDGTVAERIIAAAAVVGALGVLYVKVVRPFSRLLIEGITLLRSVKDNFLPDGEGPTLPEQVTDIGHDVKRMANSLERVDTGLIDLTERVGVAETRLDAHDYWIATHERE